MTLKPNVDICQILFQLVCDLPNALMTIGVITTFFKCQRVLISFAKSLYLLTFSSFIRAILHSHGHAYMAYLVGLLNNYNVGSVVWHLLVILDSEIPQNLYVRVFHHWFWGVFIPLISTVNSIVLAKVPMDTFGHVEPPRTGGSVG